MVCVSKALGITVLGIVLLTSMPSYAEDNVFKSSDFLKWDKPSQTLYLEASIRMAGFIMSGNSKSQSKCLGDWYQQHEEQRHAAILKTMQENSQYHPQGVILAFLEKQCGSVVYTKP